MRHWSRSGHDAVHVSEVGREATAGAPAAALADLLERWAACHPRPYRGPHWPR